MNSKAESTIKEKTYGRVSTKNDSKCLHVDSVISNPNPHITIPLNSLIVKGITKKMQEVEQSQKQLVAKFKKVQENLEK